MRVTPHRRQVDFTLADYFSSCAVIIKHYWIRNGVTVSCCL